ncbi:MAG: hypothetical protein DFNUSKGM_000923 [Candidatus Fervidibacter sacchari]
MSSVKVLHLINTLSADEAELHLLTLCWLLKRERLQIVMAHLKEGQRSWPPRPDFGDEGIRLIYLGGDQPWDGHCASKLR